MAALQTQLCAPLLALPTNPFLLFPQDLVSKMLHVDPHQRLTAKQVLQHPWIDHPERQAPPEPAIPPGPADCEGTDTQAARSRFHGQGLGVAEPGDAMCVSSQGAPV